MIGRTNCTQKSGSPSEFVNIQMLTNQAEHSNLNGAVLTMSYETYSKQYTWDGKEITFSVPAHVSCTIEFPEVEGYKKPDNIIFVAVEGNSRTIEAEYKAELVKVNVTSSNGSSVSGATLTIAGKEQTWNGTEIRQLVPFGTQYSVVASAMSGFGTPSTQTFTAQNPEREVSVVYIASSLKVNILSNQGTDAAIANVKATVKYGSTSVEVANGGMVNLPSGTSGTITFPDVEGYKKPSDISFTHNGGITEKTGTYQCELLTVNVSADSGSVSGFEISILKAVDTVGVATKYTKLEYIESDGSQYINTGYKPNQDTRLVMDVQKMSTATPRWFFCARTSSFTVNYGLIDKPPLRTDYGESKVILSESISAVERMLIDKNKNQLFINNTLVATNTASTFSSSFDLYLCTSNDGGIATDLGIFRIYSCQIYDNGTLVRDYIPALRSDGIAGLYDAVNDSFVSSSGSGNFLYKALEPTLIAKQTSVTGTYKIPFDVSYTLKASNINGYDTPVSVTRIASAKSYTVNQEYTVITVKDLSLYDIYGNRINRSTANCYVIREVGQYKFPLVYGNAIKDGKVNTAAYTNNGGSYSHDFVDGFNRKITSPNLIYESGEYNERPSVGIANKDCDGVSNLTVVEEDGFYFVQFDVTYIPSVGGNIIIWESPDLATRWSWHIWLWPHDLSPVEITNSTGVKYNIMPVNLASKYDSDGVHIKNWFYQWGRMTPMLLPSAWNSTTGHSEGVIQESSKASNLHDGIREDTEFFYNSSSPYNWFGTKSYYNLWDAACTGTGNSDNDTVKTVYDPCPVGWKVPNGNTFTGLTILSSANGIVKMRRYSGDTVGVDFPLSGYRDYSDGSLSDVGSYGCVWLSSAYSQRIAYSLRFNSSSVSPQNRSYRAYGFSVRPVQDDLTKIDTI